MRLVLGGQIRLEEVGELTLQGLSRPERVHRLLGLEEAASADSGALVGRVAELRQLIGAVDRLGSDSVGGVVMLRGDAGVGKTRLVRELERRAAHLGVTVHSALVLDFGLGASRGPLAVLARQLVADGTPTEGPVAWIDPPLRPFLLSLMGVPLDDASRAIVAAAPIAELRGRINDAFAALVRATAARQRLLLIIEDLHWAGADLLSGLAAAVAGSGGAPVLYVLTSRHENCPIDPTWLAGAGNPPTTVIDLDPLRKADALALAHELMLGCEADAVARCVERAQGNPLFLEQLARHLRERFDDALPVSVQTLVQARLDRLEASHRAALRAAAVLGQRFSLAALRAVLDEPDL